MITQKEIFEHNTRFDVPPVTIDKDWVLGHVLNAVYEHPVLTGKLIFKGGTCLKKCYFSSYSGA